MDPCSKQPKRKRVGDTLTWAKASEMCGHHGHPHTQQRRLIAREEQLRCCFRQEKGRFGVWGRRWSLR